MSSQFPVSNGSLDYVSGMHFTHFYSAQAVCSASRAALLTGCYPNRIGIHGALMPWSENGINEQEVTIAELLKEKGYATAIFGKWHLGHHEKFLPLQHGFDEYIGIPYSNDMWPVDYDGTPVTDSSSKPWKAKYPKLPLRKDKWKLIFPHPTRSYEGALPGNDGWPGPYAQDAAEFALYNLRRDAGERYDVKEIYPEIVKELQALAEKARTDLGDDLQERTGNNVRECGKIEEENK